MELRTTGTVEIFKGMAGRTAQKDLGMDCCFEEKSILAEKMSESLLMGINVSLTSLLEVLL